jgi:hypothetical protein
MSRSRLRRTKARVVRINARPWSVCTVVLTCLFFAAVITAFLYTLKQVRRRALIHAWLIQTMSPANAASQVGGARAAAFNCRWYVRIGCGPPTGNFVVRSRAMLVG